MALAIRFEGLVQDGTIRDYAELARLGRVTRARMTQSLVKISLCVRSSLNHTSRHMQPGMAIPLEVCLRVHWPACAHPLFR